MPFSCALTHRLAGFVTALGLPVTPAELPDDTFLPGLRIVRGGLLLDEARLAYPGDLLHEAGHLAVTPSDQRAPLTDPLDPDDGGSEMMALAWSYAAAVHLGLPTEVVFHEHGYKGEARQLIDHFTTAPFIGVPLLQWCGMTLDAERARAAGVQPFPHMLHWLRP